MGQEYISQVSEEIEGRVTKKFSKKFSETHNYNAHIWRKIRENRTVWRSVPKRLGNRQTTDRRRQNKLLPNFIDWSSIPQTRSFSDFLDKFHKLTKDAFGVATQDNIEQFIYAELPPHLKKSINQAQLENGQKNILCRILKESWNWMVWKPQMKRK